MLAQPYLRLRVSALRARESHRRHTGSTTIFDVARRLVFRGCFQRAGTRKHQGLFLLRMVHCAAAAAANATGL